jgi:16S rRNA (guanine527-N7)-methyltransferase
MRLDDLIQFLAQNNYRLSEKQTGQFYNYLNLLKSWSSRCNLICKKDISHIIERHFLPCILLSYFFKKQEAAAVLDIGTGAGFPGMVLKIMQPDLNLVLIDAARKKCLFLKELSEVLDVESEIICQRVEQYTKNTERLFDFIVNRAVAPLSTLWQWALPLLKQNGIFYAMKGGDCAEELNKCKVKGIHMELYYPPAAWTLFSNFLLGKFIVKLSLH